VLLSRDALTECSPLPFPPFPPSSFILCTLSYLIIKLCRRSFRIGRCLPNHAAVALRLPSREVRSKNGTVGGSFPQCPLAPSLFPVCVARKEQPCSCSCSCSCRRCCSCCSCCCCSFRLLFRLPQNKSVPHSSSTSITVSACIHQTRQLTPPKPQHQATSTKLNFTTRTRAASVLPLSRRFAPAPRPDWPDLACPDLT
jgi:hypothetical protein